MTLEHAFMKATFLSPRLAEVCNTRLGSPGSARMAAASSLGLGAAGVFKTSAALTVSKASMRLSGGRVTRVEPAEEALRGTSGERRCKFGFMKRCLLIPELLGT